MNTNKKINLKRIFILVLILQILFLNFSFISASNIEDNLEIDFHSLRIIRNYDYPFPASVTIRNLNENTTLEIKKITILNDNKKIIKTKILIKNLNH